MGVGCRHSWSRFFRRVSRALRVAGVSAITVASFLVVGATQAFAAPANAPACVSGVGYGGNTGPNPNSTGTNGCVVIKYGSFFETFNYTGSDQTWTVPSGVTSVEFQLLGAGGGKGNAVGGGGGYARGMYSVNPGDVFTIIVGQGGKNQSPTETAAFTSATARRNASYGGGASGQGRATYPNTWASGGGRSAIRIAGSTEDLVTAGGGGGGGYSYGGGPGGGTSGVVACGVYQCGGGGTQSAGGSAGGGEPGTAGIKYAGGYAGTLAGTGNQASEGGGGGGGYYGGGGGGDNGGGGGGSSYIALLTGGTTVAGTGRVPGVVAPANSTVPTVAGYAAIGATLSATAGTWSATGTQSWKWQYSADGVTYTDVAGATTVSLIANSAGYYRAVETRSNMLGTVSATSTALRVLEPVITNCTPTAGQFTHCRRFIFYGAPQTFTMPSYLTVGQTFQVEAWGGGGGGVCCNYWSADPGGGAGGYVKTKVTVTTLSELFTIEVGERGQPADPSSQYGGGGAGGSSTNAVAHGASGGGLSGVFSGSGRSAPVAIVGGGGGASRGVEGAAYAGGGGGSTGNGGQGTNAVGSGRGGTTSAGGAPATETRTCDLVATSGSQFQGGSGCGSATAGVEAGGGGGGGYYGGGGGSSYSSGSNGGGGGGSGYLDTSRATSLTATVGGQAVNAPLSGGRTSDQYVAGIASGGQGYVGTTAGATGGHGMVVLQWAEPPTARPDSKSGAAGSTISVTPATNDTATSGTTLSTASLKLCGVSPVETAPNCTKTQVAVNGEGSYSVSSGTVTFTGDIGFVGTSTINYVIADGRGATASSTITITTLGPPTARADQMAGPRNEQLSVLPLANDFAEGSATLSAASLKLCGVNPAETAPNCSAQTIFIAGEGTYAVSGSSVTFTPIGPTFSYNGTRVLNYSILDSNGIAASSTITFIALPPPVTRALPDSLTVNFATPADFTPLTNDSAGSVPSDYTIAGSLSLNSSTFRLCGPSEVASTGTSTGCSQTSITVPGEGRWDLNTGTGGVTFTPSGTFVGNATPQRYAVCNTVAGSWSPAVPQETCSASSLAVTVRNPTAPQASADSALVQYGQMMSVTPLSNDTGTGLSSGSLSLCGPGESAPSCVSSTVSVPGEGTWSLDRVTGVVTFVPLPTFTGSATPMTYVSEDVVGQSASQTIAVTVANPVAPSAAADSVNGINTGVIDVRPLQNDAGTSLDRTTLFLCGGSDVSPNCTKSSVSIAGQGVWTVDPSTGMVSFDPVLNFVGVAGPLTYSVLDIVGQRTTSSMSITVSPMSAPTTLDLADSSDTGQSPIDDYTSDTTPTIEVPSVPDGQTVVVTATKAGVVKTCTFVASSNVSSCDLPALNDGVWSVSATRTDSAGNISASSVPTDIEIDTSLPSVSAPDLTSLSDLGTSTTDNLTSDATPSIAAVGVASGDVVTITATKGATTKTCSFVATPTVTSCDLPDMDDGIWNVTTSTIDAAGNGPAVSSPLAVTIDTAAPTSIGAPDLSASSDTGSASDDNQTTDRTPRIEGNTGSTGETVTITAQKGSSTFSCSYVVGQAAGCDLPSLSDGAWQVTQTVTDLAGNQSTASAALTVTVYAEPSATVAPTTTTVAPTTTTVAPVIPESIPDPLIANDTKDMARVVQGTAAVAGMPVDGWVKVERDSTKFIVTTSEGLRVEIGARKTVDSDVKFNSRGMPVFYPGDIFEIGGDGLKPNSDASTWLYSTPMKLGELKVSDDGSFTAEYPMDESVPVGDHTAKLNAIAPDGTLRVVEVAVEVIDTVRSGVVDSGNSKSDTESEPLIPAPVSTSLIAGALALLAVRRNGSARSVAGVSRPTNVPRSVARQFGAASSSGLATGEQSSDEDDEGSAEISSVGAGYGDSDHHVADDRLRLPRFPRIDRMMRAGSERIDRISPMGARILNDGAYLRSLLGAAWLLLPVLGVVLGIATAVDFGGDVALPSLALVLAALIVGSLDAFAGALFGLACSITMLLRGDIGSFAEVRGLIGLSVLVFAPALIASAVRPFTRVEGDEDLGWNRTVDFVLIVLFGAWAAGNMFVAVPILSSRGSTEINRVDVVHLCVLVTLGLRWLLENSVPRLVPRRHEENAVSEFDEPSQGQRIVSDLCRTALFFVVAESFIGMNWALWVGTAFFLVPKLVSDRAETFPNIAGIHRYLPRNLTRVVFLMFVALWWAGLVNEWRGESGSLLLYQFAFMGIPGLVLGVMDWFGRESKEWKSTPLSRIAGVCVLVIGVLMVRGYIL